MFGFIKEKRRNKLKLQPLPTQWRKILQSDMPLYTHLSVTDREELESHLKVLINEKKFIGVDGLEVTDEMRVLICAQAAVLLLHREPHYFPDVETVVIYRDAFTSDIKEDIGGGLYLDKPQARIGESNAKTRTVVLAWDSVLSGAADPTDGRNVVLHEFAHQLDSEKGYTDGAPVLSSRSAYRAWSTIMSHEFDHLRDEIAHHHKTFIDQYGATNPAEFFAVITEAFFERPRAMKDRHPQMYALLAGFYKQDPEAYFAKT